MITCDFITSISSLVRDDGLFKISSGIAIFPISCKEEATSIEIISSKVKEY